MEAKRPIWVVGEQQFNRQGLAFRHRATPFRNEQDARAYFSLSAKDQDWDRVTLRNPEGLIIADSASKEAADGD